MPTPLFSVYVREVFPRAVILSLTAMASEVTEEELTNDFGLQLLLEGRAEADTAAAASPAHTDLLEELRAEMYPTSVSLPEGDTVAQQVVASGRFEGRKLLGVEHSGGSVRLELERDYAAFCKAAEHYIYYILPIESDAEADDETTESEPSSLSVAIAGRHEWLFGSLRKGMLWESTAYSFMDYEGG